MIEVISSLSWFVVAFLQLAGGYWADRYGRKVLIAGASFARAFTFLVFTAYPSLQADLTPKEYRGKVMAFSNFVDCILGSEALLLGGFLYEVVSPITPSSCY